MRANLHKTKNPYTPSVPIMAHGIIIMFLATKLGSRVGGGAKGRDQGNGEEKEKADADASFLGVYFLWD